MTDGSGVLNSIEERAATLFLAGGGLIAANAVIVTVGIVTESEQMITVLGESVNAAGWAVVLVGLLGLYPGLADRSRWLARAGAICAAFGVVVFAVISALSLADYVGAGGVDMQSLVPLILPGVVVGSILSFLLFSVASLRSDVYRTSTSVLLVLPAIVVVANISSAIAGFDSPAVLLAIVITLAVVMLSIGTRLRSDAATAARATTAQERAAD